VLVLSRKKGESIVIGDDIELSIVDVRGDSVRIGIKAPRAVSIYRKEIYEEIIAANRQASEGVIGIRDKLDQLKGVKDM
jgi:carbon storage regulator